MSIFFTSDLHIGHEKVAKIRAQETGVILPRYVGSEIDWHDRILAERWDAAVSKDDIVYVHGDISSGSTSGQRKALAWLGERPGRKRLLKGNHDGPHDMYRDADVWENEYREVFESIRLHGRRRITLQPEGHVDVLLSHFPYMGDHKPADRHTQWRLRDEGLIILHGHTHSSEKVSYAGSKGKWLGDEDGLGAWITVKGTPQISIGVDAWEFKPVPLEEIQVMVRELEAARS